MDHILRRLTLQAVMKEMMNWRTFRNFTTEKGVINPFIVGIWSWRRLWMNTFCDGSFLQGLRRGEGLCSMWKGDQFKDAFYFNFKNMWKKNWLRKWFLLSYDIGINVIELRCIYCFFHIKNMKFLNFESMQN